MLFLIYGLISCIGAPTQFLMQGNGLSSLSFTYSLCNLLGEKPFAWSLIFLSLGKFRQVLPLSILRIVLRNLQDSLPKGFIPLMKFVLLSLVLRRFSCSSEEQFHFLFIYFFYFFFNLCLFDSVRFQYLQVLVIFLLFQGF